VKHLRNHPHSTCAATLTARLPRKRPSELTRPRPHLCQAGCDRHRRRRWRQRPWGVRRNLPCWWGSKIIHIKKTNLLKETKQLYSTLTFTSRLVCLSFTI
jgi:hypothetical protein